MSPIQILTVVGARPQIIKAAALSRAIRTHFANRIHETILHTGQHYDANMSQVFFDEMQIPAPDINLNIGSASHGRQTALMIQGIEEHLLRIKPDYLVLFGDTNSTLAGAVAAVKLRVPVVHIEAGLRSFNKSMPEEINRIMCDHASTLLFVPTETGIKNLENEGFDSQSEGPFSADCPGIFLSGDIMLDNLVHFSGLAEKSGIMEALGLTSGNFVLCTIHRDNNTDDPGRLSAIFKALHKIACSGIKVVAPLHPRTAKMLESQLGQALYKQITANSNLLLIPPVSYLEMILLEKHCRLVITDSGGVQKEAYFFRKPLIVARPETEWTEIVEQGAGIIADADEEALFSAFDKFSQSPPASFPPLYGNGNAGAFICGKLIAGK